ncbi:histidine kinase [Priestia megaterium]|nr:histidine kinase [Priestia megaterium]
MTRTISLDALCRLHTNLAKEDIGKIEEIASNLRLTADLNRANVFIDCLTNEGKHAIVVAEAIPQTSTSVYENPVVGKFVYEAFEPAVFFTLRTGKQMFLNRALTQEGKTVEQSVVPIKGANNRVIAALIMEKDISESVRNQERMKTLSKTTETLSEILIGIAEKRSIIPEIMGEALFFINPELNIVYFNLTAFNLVSEVCASECIVGTSITDYFPCLEHIFDHPDKLFMEELTIANKVFQVKKVSLDEYDQTSGALITFRDMTELREKERELVVKSVMIHEIHHRVKNNLQTVASLLRLQMRRGVSKESKVHFLESLNRILSIASVYEIILSSSSVDDVEVLSLIEKIGNILVYSPDHEDKDITIEYTGTKLLIPSDKAVSMALVINELIQNCVKHAFRGREKGKIHVTFEQNGQEIAVQIKDNGVGYSEEAKPSLGLDIVKRMITHDLSGEFVIKCSEKGTVASVRFPLERRGYGE